MSFSILRFAALSFVASQLTFGAQLLSVGIKAGVPVTDSFTGTTFNDSTGTTRSTTDSSGYIIGPQVELHLPFGLSVEADALYRPLNLNSQHTGLGSNLVAVQKETFNSWEFPVLAKYRFAIPLVKPYVELGPSFRTVGGSPGGSAFSSSGITAGAGIELRVARFRLGPEFRYTHWGSDSGSASAYEFASNRNQVEFLVGFSF